MIVPTVLNRFVPWHQSLKRISLQSLMGIALISIFAMGGDAQAASARKINGWVNESLTEFKHDIKGADQVLKSAKGILVFPHVYQAGFVVGGKYGEGALLIKGRNKGYYHLAAASLGWQLGGARKSIIIAFMNDDVLKKFRNSKGWQFGADAGATVITLGKEGSINSQNINAPVIGFVVDQAGLMYNLSLEGTKITRVNK
ncbi:MAG: hypothetical protein K2X66_06020 [Cyanobacteria bacterium]|nr:hypothetical protein [Cyanobacteriota bacterium]